MIKAIPLGGLGEIGLNSMAFECRGEMLLVDAGLMFPTAEMPGVEIVLPDFSYVREHLRKLRGIVLTHGHEDHVGALPYLLREVSVPVYGTKYTLRSLQHRLEEMQVSADLREYEPRSPVRVSDAFEVEPVQVAHSVPDGVGVLVRTPEGTVVHTGDFKIDETPPDGRTTDLQVLGEAGERGVVCLFSDSTNAESPGETPSESVVATTFTRVVGEAPGRVVVSMFASNVVRMRHLLELCQKVGRRVVLMGRSMLRTVELAREIGALSVSSGIFASPEEAAGLPPRQVLILATGSQAEPRSGLWQMLQPSDPPLPIRLQRGDRVILSARTIPGHERPISDLINQLIERGAEVIHARHEPGIHVSGHASAKDQRRVIDVVKPQHFVPIHGELRHLAAHSQIAREAGMEGSRVHLARDGDVLAFDEGRGGIVDAVAHGRLFKDRSGFGDSTPESMRERKLLSETGVVVAVLALDPSRKKIAAG
ncbi:MAG: ribonuclease J, partial [Myxococcaceae bacterium]